MSDIHPFEGNDPEINAAVQEAQRRLPELRRLLDEDARRLIPLIEGPIVKAAFESVITHKVEHMWIEDASFEGDMVVGNLANEPEAIPELSKGEAVRVSCEAISDWAYVLRGKSFGGFTVRVMKRRGLR
jgi:uncharacterized protein